MFSRRDMLAVSAAGAVMTASAASAASFGNPDSPPEGRINGKNPTSLNDPGPQNPALAKEFPLAQNPPATDINGMPQFWASFNNTHKRYQNGGWAREVTQADFAISVILNSALQIALALTPVLVFASLFFTPHLTLVFPMLLALVLVISGILGALIVNDGESTWQEGIVLVGFYVVIAASFWWGT